jgi:hypothetical protein
MHAFYHQFLKTWLWYQPCLPVPVQDFSCGHMSALPERYRGNASILGEGTLEAVRHAKLLVPPFLPPPLPIIDGMRWFIQLRPFIIPTLLLSGSFMKDCIPPYSKQLIWSFPPSRDAVFIFIFKLMFFELNHHLPCMPKNYRNVDVFCTTGQWYFSPSTQISKVDLCSMDTIEEDTFFLCQSTLPFQRINKIFISSERWLLPPSDNW